MVKYGKCGGGEREENTNRERKGRSRGEMQKRKGIKEKDTGEHTMITGGMK